MTKLDGFVGADVVDADVVVVGGGVAGLSAALGLAGRRVTLLSKMPVTAGGAGGSSVWAQGGIATALGPDDSPRLHAEDTLLAGAGLSVPEVVTILTQEGPQRVRQLLESGARFDRQPGGELALAQEAAHSRRRVLHAQGDATGAELVRALLAAVREAPWITLHGEVEALDLALAAEAGPVTGIVARQADGRLLLHRARAVVLATGGLGSAYLHTTNPPENTGDGLAMAARAGATLVDLEMVQFHPTALAVGADPLPLLTEALRGEGAQLVDDGGERFMVAEHELAELAPRDVVARALWRRLEAGQQVFLDAREAVGEDFPHRFPTVFRLCQAHGIDPRRELMPVSPAAHFHMGGIATDALGRASLPGLWACGEVASSGVHGANRLASNSLLEGLVYGARVAQSIAEALDGGRVSTSHDLTWPSQGETPRPVLEPQVEEDLTQAIRRLLWQEAGLVRRAAGLRRAQQELRRLGWWIPAAGSRLRNLHTVAGLVVAASLERRESRGGHFRADFPQAQPAWRRRLFFTLEDGVLRPGSPWPAALAAAAAEPLTGRVQA